MSQRPIHQCQSEICQSPQSHGVAVGVAVSACCAWACPPGGSDAMRPAKSAKGRKGTIRLMGCGYMIGPRD